ncbi:hypothetical protein BXZ70DRAFT_928767 [Cristinia sonorae]|uniref:Uncharacterized protein n=1 Tax=Cristinia sonorae TaxID=1940300 RepID=A0A8K0UTX3_9AGAR|nr:hypothetical protein BXZ70DRAFT_928767 [Cristinia sonorae]
MTSNVDYSHHDDHLRYLLDQRAARADLHARFPESHSDISDSPSLYSHGPFSPQPHDTQNTPSTSFHYTLSVHNTPDQQREFTDRERLNFPGASSLDLEDDPRSSIDTQSLRSSTRDFPDSGSEDGLDEGDREAEPEEDHRVSTYGPKMTVHSRAPWELGEEDEPPRNQKKKGRDKTVKVADTAKRPWGLVSRVSSETRPSVDSARSLPRSKQSFDTMSSMSTNSNGGAIFALAQASFSSTSVATNQQSQATLRDKLSIPRLRSRTNSSIKGMKLDSLDTRSITPSLYSASAHASPISHYRSESPAQSFVSHAEHAHYSESTSASAHAPDRTQEYRHPYANPEFARASTDSHNSHLEELHTLASSSSYLGPSESNATLTDTSSISGISQANYGSTISLTPIPSPASSHFKIDPRSMPGRSPPGPINKASIRTIPSNNNGAETNVRTVPSASAMPGWADNSASTIKLISLEEAQAQARERSRSGNLTSPVNARFSDMEPLPSPTSQTWSTRIRSTSASSSKARSAMGDINYPAPPLPTMPSEQTIPQRTITKKKSGFMRLFNGKDRASPPPLPSMSTVSMPSPSSVNSAPPSRRTPQRVPVPSISPDTSESGDDSQLSVREQLNARRNVPGLSIVTSSSSPGGFSPQSRGRSASPCASDATHVASVTPTSGFTNTDSSFGGSTSNSAPPTASDFLGLSLRPVSTMFSVDFAGHLVHRGSSEQNRPSLDIDSGTPTTSSGVSPLSPGFSMNLDARHGDEKSVVGIASHQDDQSAVIQALQEQIMVARRAWQRQIWELEGQVRDLKAEVEEFRNAENAKDYCAACGRGDVGRANGENKIGMDDLQKAGVKVSGTVNRPRARTGVGSRFASGT